MSAAGWGRLQYESWDNEKVEAVGNRAWGAFLRAVAWSGYKRKDGWISAAAMRKIEPDTRVWDRLRAGGMLEPREDGAAALHGWSEHNETTVRRAEREESYSRRGKAGAATRWPDSNSHASTEAAPLETDERSRSRSRSEKRDQDHGDPRERGPFKDPAGIAPPGENPDAYPGSVTPQLELVPVAPKVSADQKTRTRKGTTKGPRPDIDPATLTSEQREAFNAIVGDPTLAPITTRPAELARDLVTTWGDRLDLPTVIRAGGMYARSAPRPYTDGARFLTNQCTFALDKPAMRSRRPPGHVAPRRLTQAEWDIEVAAGRRPKEPDPEVTARNRAIHEAKLAAIRAEREAGGIAPPLPPHAAFSEEDLAALAADGADDEDPDE
jgi:hypothetical protein